MDMPSVAQLVPQILVALVMLGAVAWFRKQDRADFAAMQRRATAAVQEAQAEAAASRRFAAQHMATPSPADDTGGHPVMTSSGPHGAVPEHLAKLFARLDDLERVVDRLQKAVDTLENDTTENRKATNKLTVELATLNEAMAWMRKVYSPARGYPKGGK